MLYSALLYSIVTAKISLLKTIPFDTGNRLSPEDLRSFDCVLKEFCSPEETDQDGHDLGRYRLWTGKDIKIYGFDSGRFIFSLTEKSQMDLRDPYFAFGFIKDRSYSHNAICNDTGPEYERLRAIREAIALNADEIAGRGYIKPKFQYVMTSLIIEDEDCMDYSDDAVRKNVMAIMDPSLVCDSRHKVITFADKDRVCERIAHLDTSKVDWDAKDISMRDDAAVFVSWSTVLLDGNVSDLVPKYEEKQAGFQSLWLAFDRLDRTIDANGPMSLSDIYNARSKFNRLVSYTQDAVNDSECSEMAVIRREMVATSRIDRFESDIPKKLEILKDERDSETERRKGLKELIIALASLTVTIILALVTDVKIVCIALGIAVFVYVAVDLILRFTGRRRKGRHI